MEVITNNSDETKKLGEILALELLKSFDGAQDKLKTATVLSLEGDLGSGKTTFVQGVAKGLGIKQIPKSPTFIIMQVFEVPKKHIHLVHIDAYRISGKDLKILGWHELISEPRNIVLVEWGTRLKKFLPKESIRVKFAHGRKLNVRTVKVVI